MIRPERRKSPRENRRIPVYFRDDKTTLRGFVVNLSCTGAGIQTNRVFPAGTELWLRVDLGGKAFEARGIVRWARRSPRSLASSIPSIIGVEFTALDEAFRQYLQRLSVKE